MSVRTLPEFSKKPSVFSRSFAFIRRKLILEKRRVQRRLVLNKLRPQTTLGL